MNEGVHDAKSTGDDIESILLSDKFCDRLTASIKKGLEPHLSKIERLCEAMEDDAGKTSSKKSHSTEAASRSKNDTSSPSKARRLGQYERSSGPRDKRKTKANEMLNEFLRKYKVLIDSRKETPIFVTKEALDLFSEEGDTAGPRLSDDGLAMEWTKKFESSEWNKRAFFILMIAFMKQLKDKKVFVQGVTTRVWILQRIKEKLRKTNSEVLLDSEARDAFFEKRKTMQGRSDRRVARHEARERTAKFMSGINSGVSREEASKWEKASIVLESMTSRAGSEDETDEEETRARGSRVVRRMNQPFLNLKISNLMRTVDTYQRYQLDLSASDQRGGRPIPRITEAKRNDPRKPMAGLPVNFYDEVWLQSQSEEYKEGLDMQPDKDIPSIDLYRRKT
ncbi:hypothetical protein SCHPADRAFT_1003341 [Schizopora paradoxa]|uniref:Uncharacterized protein n=1 Tax=Schizopora paradoxa TaxID=27342 RepID=A0A0H2QXE7_9AGAM|nr:hypothetical protein SCHPADRAFT_1003341 [Schizopora paradoxa]